MRARSRGSFWLACVTNDRLLRNARVHLGRPKVILLASRIASLRAPGLGWKRIATDLGVGVGTICRFAGVVQHRGAEIRSILAAASEPYRTFYGLLAETGLRVGELCGLTVEDVDLERAILQVRQSAWRGKLGDPKTDESTRVVEHLHERVRI